MWLLLLFDYIKFSETTHCDIHFILSPGCMPEEKHNESFLFVCSYGLTFVLGSTGLAVMDAFTKSKNISVPGGKSNSQYLPLRYLRCNPNKIMRFDYTSVLLINHLLALRDLHPPLLHVQSAFIQQVLHSVWVPTLCPGEMLGAGIPWWV